MARKKKDEVHIFNVKHAADAIRKDLFTVQKKQAENLATKHQEDSKSPAAAVNVGDLYRVQHEDSQEIMEIEDGFDLAAMKERID